MATASPQLIVLACLLGVSSALHVGQTRIITSRVVTTRAAWAVRMCDAGEAKAEVPAAAAGEPPAEPAASEPIEAAAATPIEAAAAEPVEAAAAVPVEAAAAEPVEAAAPVPVEAAAAEPVETVPAEPAEMAAVEDGASDADARKPRSSTKLRIEELEAGTMVEGTVRSVQSYGAFIDIGCTTDGLLHVSEMSDSFVKDANDMFAVGDTVTVRVKSVDTEKQQVALSNKDPNAASGPPRRGGGGGGRADRDSIDMAEFQNADEKEFITGTVRSIQSFGAFVNLKEGVDGLLHISEIQEGGVKSVADVLSEGQEVQVRVVSFDDKRRIGLSMKPYVELTSEEKAEKAAGRKPRRSRGGGDFDDDSAFKMDPAELEKLTLDFEEPPMTSFEAAFARAEEVKAAKAAKQKFAPIVL